MTELWQAILRGDLSSFGLVGALLALVLIGILLGILPRDRRSLLRTPSYLLLLSLLMVLLRALGDRGARGPWVLVDALATFFLLASIGRACLLLAIRTVFAWRSSRAIPRIVEDLVQGLIYLAVALIALSIAGVEPGSLLTTSALLTAVVGLSLQDTLGNLFSGLALQAQRPFDVGDWIQFGDDSKHIGEVVEMNWRAATVRTLELNEISVPNSTLARAALENFSRPSPIVRRSIDIWAPTDVQPHRVRGLLEEATSEVPGVLSEPPPSLRTRGFSERGMHYELRYHIDDFEAREVIAGHVHDRVWYALHRARIELQPPMRHVQLHEVNAETRSEEREAQFRRREVALGGVDFLRALPVQARRRLAELSDTRVYAAGELVIRQGDRGTELFILQDGSVAVEVERRGKQRRVAQLGAGEFFGEMSLMTGAERKATVRALDDTTLLVIDKPAFQVVLESAPELAELVSAELVAREEALGAATISHATDPAQRRADRSSELLGRIKDFFSLGGAER
ncbi:MAG: mechanosensitive ion channel [Myxococcales bacterium]|nr:mechanosensitive ion channel [Myxococcales bacterium]